MDPRLYTTQNPNFYNFNPNYSYPAQQQVPYQNQYQGNQQYQTPTLFGRMVDSKDMLKVIDVPMGSYGIFPKADHTEIYVKRWTENGTTVVDTYKLVNETAESEDRVDSQVINSILTQIAAVNDKVDKLVTGLGA